MQLVSALAAGVAGAESGTAEIYQRGTATRADYYTDFEATTSVTDGSDVTLDANGGAEIYVGELCDIVVKDSGGTTVRAFTEGVSATCVEVISAAFTGTDYSGSPTAAGEPTTLSAVLNAVDDSFGDTDWQATGDVNISSILAAVSGLFISVKDSTYGATGDGATDDTTAINAAIDAADSNGGIVFFPPGTYRITTALTPGGKCWLWGCGAGASVINMDHATNIPISISTASSGVQEVRGLSIQRTTSGSGDLIQTASNTTRWRFVACDIGDASVQTGILVDAQNTANGELYFESCKFLRGAGTARWVQAGDSTASSFTKTVSFRDCSFTVASGDAPTTAFFVISGGVEFFMEGCTFDASSLSSGSLTMLRTAFASQSYKTRTRFINNTIVDPSSGADLTCLYCKGGSQDDELTEAGNLFGTDPDLTVAYGGGTLIGISQHLTRTCRYTVVDDDTSPVTIPSDQFGTVLLYRDASGAQTLVMPTEVPGDRFCLSLQNDNTGGSITFTWPSNAETGASTTAVADNMIETWEFVCVGVNNSLSTLRWKAVGTGVEDTET